MKFKLFNKQINIQLPKIKLSRKYLNVLERHRQNIPAALLMVVMLIGLVAKQSTHADAGRGALIGGLGGAAIGGAVGGGRGAAIGAGTGLLVGAVAGSASSRDRYSDPAEKRLDRLYKKKDKTEHRLSRTSSPDKQRRYQQQLNDINADIKNLEERLYGGRGTKNYRRSGYAG